MRPSRLVVLALLAIAAAAAVVFWPTIVAERRAIVVFSGTSPKPVLSWVVRMFTAELAGVDARRLDGLPDPSIGNAFTTNAWLVRALLEAG
jgi:hypothetical protein